MKNEIHIIYYALLRQERGIAEEVVYSEARTVRELFDELKSLYVFKLGYSHIKIAINSKVASWESPLQNGDTVLFIPPIAGG